MKPPGTKDDAEKIALQALTYLLQDSGKIGEFLAESGLGPKELKKQIQDPAFLGAVLDFYLNRSDLISDFARALQLNPKDIMHARLHFPGAHADSWVNTQ